MVPIQNWMRDYDPTTGRYIQPDPLGLVDGASVYGYALQSPGRNTDPRGEQSITRAGPMSTRGGGGMSMPTTVDYVDAGREILEWSSKFNPLDLLIKVLLPCARVRRIRLVMTSKKLMLRFAGS